MTQRGGTFMQYFAGDLYNTTTLILTTLITLFPFEIIDRNQTDKIKVQNNSAILFVGDLLGPRINLESDLFISKSLSEIIWKRKLTLAVGEVFYPIFVTDAARLVVRWLFSFGPYGKTVLLLGSGVSGDTFWRNNQKFINELELKYDPKIHARTFPKGLETETINSNLNFSLNETYNWLRNNWAKHSEVPVKKGENAKEEIKKKRLVPGNVKTALIISALIFTFPFISLFISLFISFIAYKSFISGRDSVAQNSFLLARTFAVVSEKASSILSYIPGVALVYKETKFAAVFAEQANTIGTHAIPIIRDSTQLLENVLGDRVYNSVDAAGKIESETTFLYNDAILMKLSADDASKKNVILAKKILTKIDFERFINLISKSRVLAGSLPRLLGQDKSKTYLVLFENNMELRPTGGFIGSFGLVTFDGGRLSDLTVNDVYSADGQLNGHVEP
ncbi:MAG: DUF4012 domain-containing protein, partial [Candidatus Woesebacteria bacterium]|nr:DUF4012 domain-containing protein [Candidatus Woesebacteria bacterium]